MDFSCKLLLSLIFLILTHFTTSVTSSNYKTYAECVNNYGNYTQGSIYSRNLNTVLDSLLANVSSTGYYYTSSGQNQDAVDAFVMCRADMSLDECKKSLLDAISEVQRTCPNRKQAVDWQGDSCVLKYANYSLYGRLEMDYGYYIPTEQIASSPVRFEQDLRILFEDLRYKAFNGGESMKVAVGNANGPDSEKIFGMVQCRPDLSPGDCNNCLSSTANDMLVSKNCDGYVGCRFLREGCFVRYEISPFYNETRMLELTTPVSSAPQPPQIMSPPPPSPAPGFAGNKTRTIVIVVASTVGVVILVITGGVIFKKRTNYQKRSTENIEEDGDEVSTVESLQYDFGKIRAATNDFSDENKLGQGGFGAVYKGKLQNGKEIAVKRLSKNSVQGDLEFKNEFLLLARLQHRNLVRLLGFSIEGEEKLLVYEFVQNSSLDQFIFDPVKRSQLDWDRRSKIIGGIARGLLYLHEDSRLRIIHRDLKASNVLLDSEMNPKIADFGTARLFVQDDQTQAFTSRVVGTYGYMAPEYAMHGQFSIKSDVFSFGVLLLEILGGRKKNSFQNDESGMQDLLSFTWKNWQEGTAVNMIDPVLKSASGSMKEMLRCIHIGLLCVQENVADRPTMASVVLMLSSLSLTLAFPSEPAFYVQGSETETANTRESDPRKDTSSSDMSKNDASISEPYPR